MPLYEFTRPDGMKVEALAPSGCLSLVIDGQQCHRDLTPQRTSIHGMRPDPHRQEEQIRRGYYRQEQKGGPWRSKFSKNQIRRTWGL